MSKLKEIMLFLLLFTLTGCGINVEEADVKLASFIPSAVMWNDSVYKSNGEISKDCDEILRNAFLIINNDIVDKDVSWTAFKIKDKSTDESIGIKTLEACYLFNRIE